MSFRDLRVWRAAIQFVGHVYRATRVFPSDERFGLAAQIRRAAVSIPSNIAEGHGRSSVGEWIQFLGHARGSVFEVETQLIVAHELGYVDDATHRGLVDSIQDIGKSLTKLIQDAARRKKNQQPTTNN